LKTYFYKIGIEPQKEGGFAAYVPKLPGCVTEGETMEIEVALACQPVLQYKKKPLWRVEGMNNFFLSVFL